MWTEKERKEEEIEKVNDNQSIKKFANSNKYVTPAWWIDFREKHVSKLSSRNDPGEILSKSLKKMSDIIKRFPIVKASDFTYVLSYLMVKFI